MTRFIGKPITRLRAETFRYGRWSTVRWVVLAAAIATTVLGALTFVDLLAADGIGPLDIPLAILFVILFGWISLGFWMATAGFIYCVRYGRRPHVSGLEEAPEQLSRTAIVMPIYNEDPHRVFAGLRTMYDSLATTGLADRFDWFVLSDTTQPDIAVREEMAWAELNQTLGRPGRIFYRRRAKNIGRKSGNIQDFCERWGKAYTYMIVLDADSLMIGPTLVQMVRRMEQSPDVGVLQVPPTTVCRNTFFARLQQFAGASYGELFATGLALVTGLDGNYFGHNAIIRLRPFIQYCGLPRLPGRPPLGGEIFSHDFVEAALIRRAGWRVVIAHDLDGSYEESPTTVLDYSKRDQRWCQGNLQHARLVLRSGLHPFSRLHMSVGIMSYVSSSLWLIMLLLGVAIAAWSPLGQTRPAPTGGDYTLWVLEGVGLFTFTMAMLLTPKFWGYVLARCRPQRMMLQRGDDAVLLSVLLETAASFFLAPIFMCFHVAFVYSALMGQSVQWSAQQRGERRGGAWRSAVQTCRWHTVVGIAMAVLVGFFAPGVFWWLAPVWIPLIVSIPMTYLFDSVGVGQWLLRHELLVIPEETMAPPLIGRLNRYLDQPHPATDEHINAIRRMIVDPAWHARHLAILDSTDMPDRPAEPLAPVIERLIADPACQLSVDESRNLLLSRDALRQVHRAIWRSWPLSELRQAVA